MKKMKERKRTVSLRQKCLGSSGETKRGDLKCFLQAQSVSKGKVDRKEKLHFQFMFASTCAQKILLFMGLNA